MEAWLHSLLTALALPQYGLSTVFVVSLVSATLLPLASIPAVFGLVKLNPELFWPAILVATAGNTAGGAITYWMGLGAGKAYHLLKHSPAVHMVESVQPPQALPDRPAHERRALAWLQHWGPPACVLSWLPVVGDPLCGVAGWLRLPFWPCVGWMAVGKFLRYLTYLGGLVWAFPNPFTP